MRTIKFMAWDKATEKMYQVIYQLCKGCDWKGED